MWGVLFSIPVSIYGPRSDTDGASGFCLWGKDVIVV